MNRQISANKNAFGFTLAEILIAIFIFGLIITMLFSSHNLIFSNIQRVQESVTVADMAKNCLDRMASDLQSIYVDTLPTYKMPEFNTPPEPYRIVGETLGIGDQSFSMLRFTSTAHLPIGYTVQQDGIAEIVYYAMETDNRDVVLRRADHLYPYGDFEENENDPILCENVKSLTFMYFDTDGTEYETWDSESRDFKYATPRLVMIILEIGDKAASQYFQTRVVLPLFREAIDV